MSRAQRIVVASVLLVIAAFGLLVVATQITTTYYLPPADDDSFAIERVVAFEPGVVGTVIGAVAVLALLTHLVVVIRRAAPRIQWVVAVVLVVATVVAAVVVSFADRPTG
ncbi:hypothetical protein ITJ57_02650 [Plantibacter sp. VKM Ac-2880]|uniref:hypothetical protein n=1 Tax=Plantibacter sp. VKM Ac-2880 TaxID=2783827 RepID=UPI00188ED351|nr:hypothetical protein [Plantibacter sp. VKM Ac-2880]MBF4567655.1 hypothetical protein [Plantibacter sp. VKM Ac-2880]